MQSSCVSLGISGSPGIAQLAATVPVHYGTLRYNSFWRDSLNDSAAPNTFQTSLTLKHQPLYYCIVPHREILTNWPNWLHCTLQDHTSHVPGCSSISFPGLQKAGEQQPGAQHPATLRHLCLAGEDWPIMVHAFCCHC